MSEQGNKPVIGIVGGVGSGKSTVSAEFVKLGATLIDADVVGHELLGQADVQAEIRRRWGDGVFKPAGGVDRKALARAVFADERELAELNRIMHPRIRARIAEAARNPAVRAVALDAAVLFEAGWDALCTAVVFVDVPDAERLARTKAARGWSDEDWRMREKSQISLDTKRRRCNYVLDNSSSVSRLHEQIHRIFHRVVHAADRP